MYGDYNAGTNEMHTKINVSAKFLPVYKVNLVLPLSLSWRSRQLTAVTTRFGIPLESYLCIRLGSLVNGADKRVGQRALYFILQSR